MHEILQYLKENGERFESEIAKDTGISPAKVRVGVANLAAKGEIIMCHSIRYEKGRKKEGMLYRVSGYIPPSAPGRKPKTHA